MGRVAAVKTKRQVKTGHNSIHLCWKFLLQRPLCAFLSMLSGILIETDVNQHTQGLKYQNGLVHPIFVYVCAFVHNFILITGLCSWGIALYSTCVFLFVPVFSVYPSLLVCSQGVKQGRVGALGYVWVRLCMYVCVCGEAMSHCGPPARPCDSWGPLRQLRPTAHSDSVIMGGLLLCFTLTHARTHTCTQTTQALVSCGPFPGCCPTRPQQGPPALHRRGK